MLTSLPNNAESTVYRTDTGSAGHHSTPQQSESIGIDQAPGSFMSCHLREIVAKGQPPRSRPQRRKSSTPPAPVERPEATAPASVGSAGGAEPPGVSATVGGDFGDDPKLIAAYARELLGAEASLIDADDLSILSRLPTDAPFQHVISARQVSRILAANGATYARFLANPDVLDAETQLMDAISTYVDRLPRFVTASKETIDETMKVFRFAYARWSGRESPDDAQVFSHYLRQVFPEYANPEAFDRLAKAISDLPRTAPLRRIAHLAHLSGCLASQRLSLADLSKMPPNKASKRAWSVIREGDHGGVAARETFHDWYARMSPNAIPVPTSAGPILDLDELAREKARLFATRNFGKSLPDLVAASEQEWGHAPRDSVTWFYDARIGTVLADLVWMAREIVQDNGMSIWYVELDIINLGGLNKYFKDDQPKANVHVRQVCSILLNALSPYANLIVPFRIGGDEFGMMLTGLSEERLRELLEEARLKIVEYTESVNLSNEIRLSDIDTAKIGGSRGFGLHSGYVAVGPHSDADALRSVTGGMINRSKRGDLR